MEIFSKREEFSKRFPYGPRSRISQNNNVLYSKEIAILQNSRHTKPWEYEVPRTHRSAMEFPVVATRFCARHPTAFTVTKTGWPWRRDLTVTDASGAAVMRVEGPFFSLFRRSLLDAESRPVLTVERSPSLFEISRRWEAFRGDSTSSKDLLFVAVMQPSLTNTGDIDVRLAGKGYRDFVGVRPWYCGTDCTVTRAGATVGQIKSSRGFFWPTKYDVRVNADVDHVFIIGLTVILEEIRLNDAAQERTRALERSRAGNKSYKY